uniref:Uncharacterized protein n=1 Tax=Anguilla anguilla TaxID=7936 RepID=A0A0E9PSE1_ANGAN
MIPVVFVSLFDLGVNVTIHTISVNVPQLARKGLFFICSP